MNRFTLRVMFALLAVITMLLTGCGSDGSDSPSSSQSSDADSSADTSEKDQDSSGKHSDDSNNNGLLAAGATALQKLPDSTVIELESEDDGAYWEVEVAFPGGARKELQISADGSQIERGPRGFRQDGKSKAKWRKRLKSAELDFKQAHKKILETRKGTVSELELDEDDGSIVWEADVDADGTEYDVTIDAGNGEVIKNEED